MTHFKTLTGLALAATLAGGVAEARELRLAPAAPPAHPANGVMYQNFQEYLPEESDGRLTGTILGPEVVNLGQMKDALQSQIAEVGNLLPLYFPADFPNMALTGELSLLGTNSQATAAAVTEYTVNCEPCQKEMRDNGLVFLGSGASDLYEFMTTTPVRTAEEFEGLRLRSGGAPWGRLAEHFGAVPAQMSVFDQFEAVSQGVIDGTMASVADLISFRMVEVIEYVTYAPIGMYQSTSNFATSAQTWDSLSAEDRAAMVRAANRANTDFTHRWAAEMPAEAEEAAREAGIEFIEADPSLIEAINDFVATEPDTAARLAAENFGIEDGDARIAEFLALVDKWTVIAEEVDNDPVAMAERIQAEVWDTLDYETYGTGM
ncbi:TRAP transporter substrate-binding protein DctP [Psychromarinibacter sp. C21-152]|uniref:TRAP transporter substrate-binding protein DctP n=1 Tax=Psychromarinibacter sediminicola TaxID=3033385 RepID=A0AAE3T9S4_9RHOB|nr:TRAP transporter substrate-binding protein DctP [Psychromarinibacter sediminicola]MDF0602542.1 TRAP transporter substrate-binding protein DctP [Psychromarinibacter sediminicola]